MTAAAAAAGSGSRQLTEPAGGDVSGPTAPCSTSPAAACSPSRVGEEGGEGRDFFLLEDSSFRRLFFSFCSNNSNVFFFFYREQLLRPQAILLNLKTDILCIQTGCLVGDVKHHDHCLLTNDEIKTMKPSPC